MLQVSEDSDIRYLAALFFENTSILTKIPILGQIPQDLSDQPFLHITNRVSKRQIT